MVKLLKKILILTLILIIGFFVLIFWESNRLVSSYANQRVEIKGALIKKYQSEIERFEMKTIDGLKVSTWRFHTPKPKAIVIVLHDLQKMDASSILDYGKFFKSAGYEAFCLDLRAHGFSKGKKICFGYEETKDVRALIDWINQRPEYRGKKIILYGLGMGGAVAINTAAELDEVKIVVSVNAFESIEHQLMDQCNKGKYIKSFLKVKFFKKVINYFYKPSVQFILALNYHVNPRKSSPRNNILKLSPRPVLIIHGEQEREILIRHAQIIKNNASEGTELWIVKGKQHLVELEILSPQNEWYQSHILDFIEHNLKLVD